MKKGDKVWFRGRFAKEFSVRGEIEVVDTCNPHSLGIPPAFPVAYGVRLENGNFHWAGKDQLKRRGMYERS